jgi:hypothetical protein
MYSSNTSGWGRLLSLSDNTTAIPSIDLVTPTVLLGRNKACHVTCQNWPDAKKYSSKHCELHLKADEAGDFEPYITDWRYACSSLHLELQHNNNHNTSYVLMMLMLMMMMMMMLMLCSTNGTFLNGTLIGKGNSRKLTNKDSVTLLISGLSHPHFNKQSMAALSHSLTHSLTHCASIMMITLRVDSNSLSPSFSLCELRSDGGIPVL